MRFHHVVGRTPGARVVCVLAALSICSFRAAVAPAQTIINENWVGGTSGSWFTSTNWTPHNVPNNVGSFEFAVNIAQPDGVTVNVDGSGPFTNNATIDSLNLSAANSSVVISGFGQLTVTNANAGNITIGTGASIQITGGDELDLAGNVTTQGGGSIVLPADVNHGIGSIAANVSNVTLTNALTIRGSVASVYGASGFALVNQAAGVIDADGSLLGSVGASPFLDLHLGAASTNAGTMRASNGGVLNISNEFNGPAETFTNTGTITALDGSEVDLLNLILPATATGQLTSSGTGHIYANGVVFDGTAMPFNNAATLDFGGVVKGTLNNTGTITGGLVLVADTTFTGSGMWTLNTNSFKGPQDGITITTLTNASTINGNGEFGVTQTGSGMNAKYYAPLALVNQAGGLVDASTADGSGIIQLFLGGPSSNAGTLRASNGGQLQIESVDHNIIQPLTNAGTIAALDGSSVVLTNINLVAAAGNQFTTSGSGVITFSFGSSLDGTAAAVVNTGTLQLNGPTLKGTLTNNGTTTVGPDTTLGRPGLGLTADATINGTGATILTIDQSGTPSDIVALTSGVTLTNASTISGAGQIGGDLFSSGYGNLALVNQSGGLIDANSSGQTLTVVPNPSLSNAGTLRASGGGTLAVTGGGSLTNTGAILAQTGGTVSLLGVSLTNLSATTLTNGSYQASGTGSVLQLANNANVTTLSNASVTLDGAGAITDQSGNDAFRNLATVGSGSALNLLNGHAQSVAAGLANNGGTVSLSGTGSTSLTVTAAYSQTAGVTDIAGPAATLTAPTAAISGGTLRGNGTFASALTVTGGTVSPGESPGTLTVTGSLALSGTASLLSELSGTAKGTTYDFLSVSGTTSLGGTLQVALLSGFRPSGGNTFTVLTAGSPLTGSFANAANGSRLTTSDGTGAFTVNYGPTSPFDPSSVVLSNFAAVPEPVSMALLLGAAGWAALRRRRRPPADAGRERRPSVAVRPTD